MNGIRLLTALWLCLIGAASSLAQQPLIHLPIPAGKMTQVMQGVNGVDSHQAPSTRYGIVFDSPNDSDEPVVAGLSGTAYVHLNDPGFGNHVNIDAGNGYFVIAGSHMYSVSITNGQFVTLGQAIGVEGSTGISSGDHIHSGFQQGNPAL